MLNLVFGAVDPLIRACDQLTYGAAYFRFLLALLAHFYKVKKIGQLVQ